MRTNSCFTSKPPKTGEGIEPEPPPLTVSVEGVDLSVSTERDFTSLFSRICRSINRAAVQSSIRMASTIRRSTMASFSILQRLHYFSHCLALKKSAADILL